MARLSGRSYEEMRGIILEFLHADVFHISVENCVSFLDPLIESWDIDLVTFGIEIVLYKRLPQATRRNSSSLKESSTNQRRKSRGSKNSFVTLPFAAMLPRKRSSFYRS
jgi:hypothetical protein